MYPITNSSTTIGAIAAPFDDDLSEVMVWGKESIKHIGIFAGYGVPLTQLLKH